MYATVDDLIGRIGSDVLADLAQGEIDQVAQNEPTVRVQQAIESATNLINSYLQSRYPTPLDPVPPVVRDKAIDIALHQLASWRGWDPEEQGKTLVAAYRSAERWLQDVAKGIVSLGQAPAPPPPGGALINSKPRVFSRDKLSGW
jgi:phage gp36-like protein